MNIEIRNFINPQYSDMYPVKMEFEWSTDIVSTGRKSHRNQEWSQPRRHWHINWDALKQAGRAKFIEIFNRAHGQFRTFQLLDRDDYLCELTECSITAAGGETATQLIKSYYDGEAEEWDEDKKKIVPSATFAPVVKIDAATKTEDTHFTLDDTTGIIDWMTGSAPNGALGAGEVVTANYQFYFQVRFGFDKHADIQNLPQFWRAHGVHLLEDE